MLKVLFKFPHLSTELKASAQMALKSQCGLKSSAWTTGQTGLKMPNRKIDLPSYEREEAYLMNCDVTQGLHSLAPTYPFMMSKLRSRNFIVRATCLCETLDQ